MKTLIVEDDFTSRLFLQELLREYGAAHIAVNGQEAIEAVRVSLQSGEPYDLICLDIMMPEMDGHSALQEIRNLEKKMGWEEASKIIMTTALSDPRNVMDAFSGLCDAYLVKPIRNSSLVAELVKLKLIS